MIPYSRHTIGPDDIREVVKVLKSSNLTQGPCIKEFEDVVASYCGARYAVAFNSGTAALHAAYSAAGVGHGDEVIVPALTFAATANAALYLGAKPIFADIVCETGILDVKLAARAISKKTKVIVAVDYAGMPANLADFKKLCKSNNLVFIEDGAQSLGARYRGTSVGAQADMTMFSFHPVKSITTGEGGIITTNNKTYYERMMRFRTHGITKDSKQLQKKDKAAWYHEMQELGFNYRITDIQAVLGTNQMKKLDSFIARRTSLAKRYLDTLSSLKHFELPVEIQGVSSAWHLFVVRVRADERSTRDKIFSKLHELGIGAQVHYLPVYLHPYYEKLGYKRGLCPKTEIFSESAISIPLFPTLTRKEQDFIIASLKQIDEEL